MAAHGLVISPGEFNQDIKGENEKRGKDPRNE